MVRPPTVARVISVPQRGQCAPGRRNSMIVPVWTPPFLIAERVAARSARCRACELLGRELVGRAARRDPGLPERLVGEQVADAGHHGLIQQPGLDRRPAAADPFREFLPADCGGIRSEHLDIWVQPNPAEPTLVEQSQRPTVGEEHAKSDPDRVERGARGRSPGPGTEPVAALGQLAARVGDQHVTADPEVQAQHRSRRYATARCPTSRTTSPCPVAGPPSAAGRPGPRGSHPADVAGRPSCRCRPRRRCGGPAPPARSRCEHSRPRAARACRAHSARPVRTVDRAAPALPRLDRAACRADRGQPSIEPRRSVPAAARRLGRPRRRARSQGRSRPARQGQQLRVATARSGDHTQQ